MVLFFTKTADVRTTLSIPIRLSTISTAPALVLGRSFCHGLITGDFQGDFDDFIVCIIYFFKFLVLKRRN